MANDRDTTEQLHAQLQRARARLAALERDKQRAEHALRALQNDSARYLELAEVLIVALDSQARVTMIGGNSQAILGYTAAELVGQDWFQACLPAEDGTRLRAVFNQLLSGDVAGVEYYENDILTRSGERRRIAWHNALRTDDSGRITGTLSSGVDVTARKQVQDRLAETDRLFASLVSNLPGMVYRCRNDAARTLEYTNDGCFELTGYRPADLLAGNVSYGKDIIHPDDQSKVWGSVQASLSAQRPYQLTYRIITADKQVRWVWEQGSGVFAPSGELIALGGFIKDMTDSVRAADALRETRQMLEKAQQIAHVGSWVWDIEHMKFISWSDEMHRIFDVSKEEFDGTNRIIEEAVHPDDRHLLYAAQEQVMKTGRPAPIEYRIKRKDGSITTVYANGECVFDETGKLIRMVGTCQDITLQKRQEERIRRSQKMDALGTLTGGIAHDYNNMLGVILGYTRLLRDALHDDPKLSRYVNEIQRAGERGAKLSRKLLAFSSQKQPKAGITNANAVLAGAQDMLQKTLTPRIALAMDLAPDAWSINVDSNELEDAILNLSINAMHAMESGGNLTIRTRNKHITDVDAKALGLTPGDYVVLSVSDTGSGMDAETLSKIFDPFFTTKGERGVGLGLSMVYGLVQRSGGQVKVSSTLGNGSQFDLYFPRQTRAPRPAAATRVNAASGGSGSGTILVVDDEPALAHLCAEMLAPLGYRVLTARSGNEALRVLASEAVDLLLSDVIMPGMDGYELATTVRRQWPAVKIQLMSGYAETRHKDPGNLPLAKKVIHKPFAVETLLQRVQELLSERSLDAPRHPPTVMVMDDDDSVRELFRLNLERLGFQFIGAADGAQAVARYKESVEKAQPIDVGILDISVPGGMGGKETAQQILALNSRAKLIVSSGDSYGAEMTNYRDYGFSAAIEKTFDRSEIERVIRQVMS